MTDRFHTLELSDPALEQEGLRLATIKSPALGRRTDLSFWVPPGVQRVDTLLLLLHGVYGSHWVWSLKGGAHRTAAHLVATQRIAPVVIAMPSDGLERDGSAYLSWPAKNGQPAVDLERFLLEEVPAVAELAAPALHPGYKLAIAGLSMGGYGALRLGAKHAGHFCAISAHSAITNPEDLASFVEEPLAEYLATVAHPDELDALFWLRRHAQHLPPLRFDCGLDDPLLASNRRLHAALDQLGIRHEYQEFAGAHDWSYWQQHLTDTLLHVDRHSHRAHST